MRTFIILSLLIVLACCQQEPSSNGQWQPIRDRTKRTPLYQMRIPEKWEQVDDPIESDIQDTKLPIAEYAIVENGHRIRITVHSFPSQRADDRVPPNAQITRWKQQIEELDPASVIIKPQTFSGYVGQLFEGTGKEIAVMGWVLQIAPEHYPQLHDPQQRADITIKAVGSIDLVKKHRFDIIATARTFELIDEIPAGL